MFPLIFNHLFSSPLKDVFHPSTFFPLFSPLNAFPHLLYLLFVIVTLFLFGSHHPFSFLSAHSPCCLFHSVRWVLICLFTPSTERAINLIKTCYMQLGDQTNFSTDVWLENHRTTRKSEERQKRECVLSLKGEKCGQDQCLGLSGGHRYESCWFKQFLNSWVTHCPSPARTSHHCSSDPMHASISSQPPLACEGLNS